MKEGPLDYPIAQDWVSKADACGTHWTLPTSTHAATLFSPTQTAGTGYRAKGESYPAHISPLFSSIGECSWIWLSGERDTDQAPAYNLNIAKEVRLAAVKSRYPACAFGVRALRPETARAKVEDNRRCTPSNVDVVTSRPLAVDATAQPPLLAVGRPLGDDASLATRSRLRLFLESYVASKPYLLLTLNSGESRRARQAKKRSFEECVDEACQIELGSAAAANYLVLSTLDSSAPGTCVLRVNLVELARETVSASVVVHSGEACSQSDMAEMARQVADELFLSYQRVSKPRVVHSALAYHLSDCGVSNSVRLGPGPHAVCNETVDTERRVQGLRGTFFVDDAPQVLVTYWADQPTDKGHDGVRSGFSLYRQPSKSGGWTTAANSDAMDLRFEKLGPTVRVGQLDQAFVCTTNMALERRCAQSKATPCSSYECGVIRRSSNTVTATLTLEVLISGLYSLPSSVQALDVNSDGHVDLRVQVAGDKERLILNTGTEMTVAEVAR